MTWDLPISVKIGENFYNIRDKCNFKVILDCLEAIKDDTLSDRDRALCALYIFYEDFVKISELSENEINEAVQQMYSIIDGDNKTSEKSKNTSKPIVDFNKDFPLIASALLPILGYDIRSASYLHWWTFLGAFREIKDGVYKVVLQIRTKQSKGIKLEKEERQFYTENKEIIDLPLFLTDEEKEFLFSD